MKTASNLLLGICLICLSVIPELCVAQQMVDRSPVWFYHDDTTYIRSHDNNKYFQEYTNHNGKIYMYYNKTYNNESKDLSIFQIQFDSAGKISEKTKLIHKDHSFSSSLYFEKDINMNSAFFGVDDFLFVVVQNKKDEKNQMYRYSISLDTIVIVDLDNSGIYDRYFSAVTSGYDVILFTRGYAESYTFSKTDNNLHFNERIRYEVDSEDATVVSAVAMVPPGKEQPLAYAALKDPGEGNFQICSYNFKDLSDNLIQYDVFRGKSMRLISGRSYLPGDNQIANTDGSAYISIFSVKDEEYKENKSKPYFKRCPIIYGEIKLTEISFLAVAHQAYINLPSDDYYAATGDDALISIVENYVPGDYSTFMSGSDGFQKQNILVNCDKSNETNYSIFPSDFYVINHNDPPIESNMAAYSDDQWKNTWTLIGIFDGPPPCALNWHAWDSIHYQVGETAPTELRWKLESTSITEISTKTEISWSLGFKGKGSFPFPATPLHFKIDGSAKYAQTNENLNTMTSSKKAIHTIPMPLTEDNQDKAVWYWLAPTIKRFAYSTYDYSDNSLHHPVLDRIDYAFITTDYQLIPEFVPIGSAPHYVSEPNAPTMDDWTARADITNDTTIGYHAFHNDLNCNAHIAYNSTHGGGSSALIGEKEQSSEQTVTKGVKLDIGVGVEIPDIFSFQVIAGFDYDYTRSSKTTTKFTQEIEFDMTNLKPGTSSAISQERYTVNCFLFLPDDNPDWWYFQDTTRLRGFKPWYIAYTVELVPDKTSELLNLIQPEPGEVFYVDEAVDFWWKDSLQHTKLVISNAPTNSLKAIVYSGELNTKPSSKVTGLGPGVYYWRVAGISKEGLPVWSEFRKFTVVNRDFLADNNNYQNEKSRYILPAKVYPNPALDQNISVTYEVKDDAAPVEISLYDMSGVKLWEMSFARQEAGIHNKVIQTENLTTHFGILKIINGNYIATQKIVVY